eukprot:4658484-Amphidinium_carterae.1
MLGFCLERPDWQGAEEGLCPCFGGKGGLHTHAIDVESLSGGSRSATLSWTVNFLEGEVIVWRAVRLRLPHNSHPSRVWDMNSAR